MFYFDEDHMENGFDAPVASDTEEDQSYEGVRHQLGVGVGVGVVRSSGDGLMPSKGNNGWLRTRNSGSTTTSSTGSCSGGGGGRFSSEATPINSHYERADTAAVDVNSFSDPFNRPTMNDLSDDALSESEEQPAELVPLGMRTHSLSGCKGHHHHRKKARAHFTDFYKLVDDHLGAGAYASVRTGVSLASGKEFAVKLIDKHKAGHTRSRVMHEVETFNLCKNHPNIVQLHEWFEDQNRFYLVFEKMRGGPLLDHIQRKKFFTEQEACKVTKDIATALKFLHDRGIAHRDVKPENVLCSDIDRVSPVKLCDLDLASKASAVSPPKLTSVNSEPDLASPVGSAEFMAPEVVDAFVGDALKYDKRCDMWSLGVIVYIMICGYPPFYGECWRENCGWDQGLACNDCQESLFKRIQRGEFDFPEPEWEDVSEEAKDLICHLLVKNVRERFTADEVLKHPWVKNGAPNTKLQTPSNLFRNDSTRDVHQIQEHFNVMNRIVAARLSARMEQSEKESESSDDAPVVISSPEKCMLTEDILLADQEQSADSDAVTEENIFQTNGTAVKEANLKDLPKSANTTIESESATWWNGKMAMIPNHMHMPPPQIQLVPTKNGATHLPPHVSQMPFASPLYADGVMLMRNSQQQPAMVPLHPNQLINVNGVVMYRHMGPQSFYSQQSINEQHLYKYGAIPQQQFMARPPPPLPFPPHLTSYQHTGNAAGYLDSALDCRRFPPIGDIHPNRGIIGTRSANSLQRSAVGNSIQSTEKLETCQGAMAKQDSKTDLRSCQAHETQVNV